MERPSFLNCATDEEWEEWFRMSKRVSTTSPANVLRTFCADCTKRFFEYNVDRDTCFQAKYQDGRIKHKEVIRILGA